MNIRPSQWNVAQLCNIYAIYDSYIIVVLYYLFFNLNTVDNPTLNMLIVKDIFTYVCNVLDYLPSNFKCMIRKLYFATVVFEKEWCC